MWRVCVCVCVCVCVFVSSKYEHEDKLSCSFKLVCVCVCVWERLTGFADRYCGFSNWTLFLDWNQIPTTERHSVPEHLEPNANRCWIVCSYSSFKVTCCVCVCVCVCVCAKVTCEFLLLYGAKTFCFCLSGNFLSRKSCKVKKALLDWTGIIVYNSK